MYRAYPEGMRQHGPFGRCGRIDQPAPAASSPGCLPECRVGVAEVRFRGPEPKGSERRRGYRLRGTDVIWWSHQLRNTYPTLFLYQRVFAFSTKIQRFFYYFSAFYFISRAFHFSVTNDPLRNLANVSVRLDSERRHLRQGVVTLSAIARRRCASRTCRSSIIWPSTTMTALPSACPSR